MFALKTSFILYCKVRKLLFSLLPHVVAWVLAYSFYACLVYLVLIDKDETGSIRAFGLLQIVAWGIYVGIFIGLLLGLIDQLLLKKVINSKRSIGFVVLVKSLVYSLTILLTILVGVATWVNVYGAETFIEKLYQSKFRFTSTFIYSVFITVLISFISQINRKFGPGILLPLFFGKYHQPKVEKRIFMFLDLKDSTPYAEKLGHIKFSQLIQDCFLDLNAIVPHFKAEIYQYVGDEAILSWKPMPGIDHLNCIDVFFAFQKKLVENQTAYQSKYDLIPEFKAGVHIGEATIAEVGDVKREIAYHGDVLNTAARIQSVCNTYQKKLLISEKLAKLLSFTEEFEKELVGEVALKGKSQPINIFSIEKK